MTDTWQDGKDNHVPMVFLAGPVKHWWTCWGSTPHDEYLNHRGRIHKLLVKNGYLVYTPWIAWRGPWDKRAQLVNQLAILTCDAFLWLTPTGIPDVETQHERQLAEAAGKPAAHVLPFIYEGDLLGWLEATVGRGLAYD